MTWPTKTDFVDGDVLTASQVNNIGTNLNVFDPTSATAGQVPLADGAGSAAWGSISAESLTQIATGSFSGTTYNITSIPSSYKHLYLEVRNWTVTAGSAQLYFYLNTSTVAQSAFVSAVIGSSSTTGFDNSYIQSTMAVSNTTQFINLGLTVYDYASATYTEKQMSGLFSSPATTYIGSAPSAKWFGGRQTVSGAVNRISFLNSASQNMTGSWILYGVK